MNRHVAINSSAISLFSAGDSTQLIASWLLSGYIPKQKQGQTLRFRFKCECEFFVCTDFVIFTNLLHLLSVLQIAYHCQLNSIHPQWGWRHGHHLLQDSWSFCILQPLFLPSVVVSLSKLNIGYIKVKTRVTYTRKLILISGYRSLPVL